MFLSKILSLALIGLCSLNVIAAPDEVDYEARRQQIMQVRKLCVSLVDPQKNLAAAEQALGVTFVKGSNGYRFVSAGQQFTDQALLDVCSDMLPEGKKHLQYHLFVFFHDQWMLTTPSTLPLF